MSKSNENSAANKTQIGFAGALTHLLSCLAMSIICVTYGWRLSELGDFTNAKTYHAGGVLMLCGIGLFFISIGGLGKLPSGRWRGWRQPVALAVWIPSGALLAGWLEVCSNGTCCTGSIYDLVIGILAWTWLPAFWLVKITLDRLFPQRTRSS